MEIVAAVFIDNIDLRPVPGPSTRIDLTGIQFSAPATEFPFEWAPHLCVILRCDDADAPNAALEVVFEREGEQVARNVQPVQIEPGRFGYRLVRAEIDIAEPCTIVARCRVDMGHVTTVPFTHLPPVDGN